MRGEKEGKSAVSPFVHKKKENKGLRSERRQSVVVFSRTQTEENKRLRGKRRFKTQLPTFVRKKQENKGLKGEGRIKGKLLPSGAKQQKKG